MSVWDSHRIYECGTCKADSNEGPTLGPPPFWFTVVQGDARRVFCSAVCVAAYHAPVVFLEPNQRMTIGLQPGVRRQTLTFEERA